MVIRLHQIRSCKTRTAVTEYTHWQAEKGARGYVIHSHTGACAIPELRSVQYRPSYWFWIPVIWHLVFLSLITNISEETSEKFIQNICKCIFDCGDTLGLSLRLRYFQSNADKQVYIVDLTAALHIVE